MTAPTTRAASIYHFEPLVREVFDRKAYDEGVLQAGVVSGLPAV